MSLQLLNNPVIGREKNGLQEKIIQFGEGNFLRAFVNWMIDQMNQQLDFNAGVVVVQPLESGMIDVLNDQDGLYNVYLKGLKNNSVQVDRYLIECIKRAINPYRQADEYFEMARSSELRFVISNTTEAGIQFNEEDELSRFPQKTFPGKLTAFLHARFLHFEGSPDKGLIFLPCELIDKNGRKLKEAIMQYADHWSLGSSFIDWINASNTFCNTLVDRIVPGYPKDRAEELSKELGYIDNLIVEGEQFHLWVIEGPDFVKDEFPIDKTDLNVVFTHNLKPYRDRKVKILNGAHTIMVSTAIACGINTVKEVMDDPILSKYLKETIYQEITPTLDLEEEELRSFAEAVLQRFSNPFIKHYLKDISLNSISKFRTRVLPSIVDYQKNNGHIPKKLAFALASLLHLYKESSDLKDDQQYIDFIKNAWINSTNSFDAIHTIIKNILSNIELWGQDLSVMPELSGLTANYFYQIAAMDVKSVLSEL
ncbi:tagaturonate reductase [Fulvivirgaceae bacterium BMA10]|uniref:Tagaturonate reductase n=1 Tax=Splendidivirga corallicola TaxID=3051826 RepID=A0ABT8KRN3_9BACT|nr:tagaturonate reductase [Fulvivirgaceae bacterium BMA10]